jgi:hypothetical protein
MISGLRRGKRNSNQVNKLLNLDEPNLSHMNGRLSLRKEKLEEMIFSKRIKQFDTEELQEKELEVNIKELQLPNNFFELFEEAEDKDFFIQELLFENDKNLIKYGLRSIRGSELRIVEYGEDEPDIEFEDRVFDRILFLLFEEPDVQIKVNFN